MKKVSQYIHDILGIQVDITPISKNITGNLPIYIFETYKLYRISLFNIDFLLAELIHTDELSILQTEKQVDLLRKILNKKVVVVLDYIASYNRKRLIEKGINFIVPGKQLFLPDLLIDLRESHIYHTEKQKAEKLLPSAQLLLLYQILFGDRKWNLEKHSFKEIAYKFDYTPMTITNAIDNLKYHELIDVIGGKEKFIRFQYKKNELWDIAEKQSLFINPVLKTVFADEIPDDIITLKANVSALAEYTDLNPSRQLFFSIEKTVFYGLEKRNVLVNLNEKEGKYALEVWKYNPTILTEVAPNIYEVVDPLSLYLSIKDKYDERIQIALDQIIRKYIW